MMKRQLAYLLVVLLALGACKKKDPDNPYDTWHNDPKKPVVSDKPIDPSTIEGLHKNIFKPTCANSGCHDGNFEPDFRSIESSYNSLVNRNTTNPDPGNPQFNKRVVPGSAATSMILHRILEFIPGTQGKMPLQLDPGSDWPQKQAEYIQHITTWINNGAKDQFGNSASSLDFIPQAGGMLVFADGSSTPLAHSMYSPIQVPGGTNSVKIMIAYTDDKTAPGQFGPSSINFSLNPNSYDSAKGKSMVRESAAFNGGGVQGVNVDYWFSITLPVSELGTTGDVLWVQTRTTDNVNAPVFIPSNTTAFNTRKYFAIKLN